MIKRVFAAPLAFILPVVLMPGCGSGRSAETTPTTATTSTTVATASSSPTTGTGGTATTTRTGSSSTTPAPAAGTIRLTDKDDGTTVRIVTGTTLVVALGSTYWMFPTAPNAAVLQRLGGVSIMPAPIGTCIPGGGCGTASVTYKAVGSGPAEIRASRTSCGEARACTGNQGAYSVQVVVSAG